MIPGEYFIKNDYIILNKNKEEIIIKVSNTGDRPVQVGSHFHFFEVNKCLLFDRKKAYGMRLNVPSGTAVRFEPGEEIEVTITPIGGEREVYGLNGLTSGKLDYPKNLESAMTKIQELGFSNCTSEGVEKQ